MRHIVSESGGQRTCPNVNIDDDAGQWFIVGYATSLSTFVELPAQLAPEWVGRFPLRGGRLLVNGSDVTEPAILAELDMDPDEAAVSLPVDSVPMLSRAVPA